MIDRSPRIARFRVTLTGLVFFFCSLLLLTTVLVWSDATRKVDRLLYDSWVRFHQTAVPDDVVIVAFDTESLNAVGRWPWSRKIQAQLIERLAAYQPDLVVFDVLYTEASEVRVDDLSVGGAIGELQRSVLPVLTETGGGRLSTEALPIADIVRQASSLGHVFLPIDDDGIVRRTYLKAGIKQAHWSTLALAGLELLDQAPLTLPGRIVPDQREAQGFWALDNEVYIPFYGASGSFPRIPAVDILQGEVSPELLQNKVVFVGLTAAGLGDVVPTPVSALNQPVPGVEIHANIFSALREGSMVARVDRYSTILLAFFLLALMLLVYSRAPPEWSLIGALVGSVVPVVVSFLMYRYASLWFAPFAASAPILGSYLVWSRHRLMYVNRFLERERETSMDFMPQRPADPNQALARFFNSALLHLPVEGWRFSIGREQYSGGEPLPKLLPAGQDERWVVRNDYYVKRYPTADGLLVELRISEPEIGAQLGDYIDSLARVRAKERASLLSGSIEKLQTNVRTLREQLEWLRSVRAFADTMLDAAPAGFSVWNPAGECIRSNQLIHQLVSGLEDRANLVSFIQCLGRDPLTGDDARQLQQLITAREPWMISYHGEARELVVNFRAVGKTLLERLICVTVVDVTEIRTAERARAEMVDYLSHDLRSPLISALYLLESHPDSRIARNIQSSLAMMDDLLHIARADSLTEARFQPLLLNSVLDNSLDQLLPQARNRNIRFELQTIDDELWVVGDAASLERAISNIVGNAIKYSPEDTLITINLTGADSCAVLTVDDQGVGIDPDMLDQLFARFRRDSTTADSHKGIGLGLALVARVVGLHGGQVHASNLPVGTRINLSLPLEKPASQ